MKSSSTLIAANHDIKVFAQLAGRPIERRLSNSLERAIFGHLREF
jgi:hypothetical protein